MSFLENPIWSALATQHRDFALGDESFRRYPREITTMGAFESLSPVPAEAWSSLSNVTQPRETIAVLFHEEPKAPNGFEIAARVKIVQMVHDGRKPKQDSRTEKIHRLGAEEADEIVELAKLTNPGPIGLRSYEIGDFIGIRDDKGQLIAMAGERFRFPGYAEISGVCTRPGFEGRGLAAHLVVQVMRRIRDRGDIPFLHSRADNDRAVKLYERLGFVTSRNFPMAIVRRGV